MKLTRALESNSSLKFLDLSRNALGFQAVYELQCACSATGLLIKTGGNHVFEEIMNAVSHAVGFIASVVGSTLLMTEAIAKGTDYHYWSAALFSFSLMFLFFSSTLYHSFFMLPSAAWILQIFDHVGIYFLIAGSYTPFMLIGLHHSSEARFLLAVEWLLAALGAIYAASVDLSKPMTNVIECTVFLTMGFGCILVLPQMNASMPVECVNLLFVGGAAYALGIIFYVMGEYKPIFHVFWHCVVVLAAALHWFAVYFYVMPMDLDRDLSMYSSS